MKIDKDYNIMISGYTIISPEIEVIMGRSMLEGD